MFFWSILDTGTILLHFCFFINAYVSVKYLLVIVVDDGFGQLGHERKNDTIFVLFDSENSLLSKTWKKAAKNRFSIVY